MMSAHDVFVFSYGFVVGIAVLLLCVFIWAVSGDDK